MPISSPEWQGSAPAPEQRDEDNFIRFYRVHAAFVWRTLRRFGVELSSVEDATQETFLVAHKRQGSFDGAYPRAWLAAIARRVASDFRRRAENQRICAQDSQHDLALARESLRKCEAEHSRDAAAELVHRLLDSLDDEKRQVFVLSELEGMSMPEVAEATGLNLNTAYSRLRAAKLQMKAEYARVVAREKWRMP